jgi:hypothetical protein
MTVLRALAFGDLDAGEWGVAWLPESATPASLVVGLGSSTAVVSGKLVAGEPADEWRLDGDAAELVLSPLGAPVSSGPPNDGIEGFDQLCTVSGRFQHNGEDHAVDCLGWRSARRGRLELDRLGSFRQVSTWFGPDDGLALLALRPRKSRGQDADVLAAAVLDPARPHPVADPRLSTTYTAAGFPARAGLELWFEDESSDAGEPEATRTRGEAEATRTSGEPDDDRTMSEAEAEAHQYPRRAAGEAVGAHADWTVAEFDLHAELFRWHDRGRDGAGVYLLGSHR